MKNLYLFISLLLLSVTGNAQSLLKDLNPGTPGSQPKQFTKVNNTMYFITNNSNNYRHALWKTDGTAANTVIVKDSIITTNVGLAACIRVSIDDTLYYSVNAFGISAGDTTRLWKTHGNAPVMVAKLVHPGYPGFGGGYPTNFTVVGKKIFFSMWKDNGRELWVTDGTTAGTQEVIDLNTGNNGAGLKYSGVEDTDMGSFNGKVYFSGGAAVGTYELYSSDGTAGGTTLVKAGVLNPHNFIVYKNELYFAANGGAELWKTDGTTAGTVKVTTTSFTKATIFKNVMYYSSSNKLYKSDGTAAGTALVRDSAGSIIGANADNIYTSFMKSLTSPPYYQMLYWKSDGTTAGTMRVSDTLGKACSFAVLNNKMYNTTGYDLWETDGTEAGSKHVLTGVPGVPFSFNGYIFFSNFQSATGYELWSLGSGATTGIRQASVQNTKLFPNPSSGIVHLNSGEIKNGYARIFNFAGEEVYHENLHGETNTLDLNYLKNGMYLLQLNADGVISSEKLVIQK